MEEKINKAASLSAWLIREKGRDRRVAVIIGCNKYKVPFSLRSKVNKKVTELNKGVPLFKL
ncbi:MAG: hypothetical protein GY861_03365 [bacterium]|nr:hypothetical protein [bacterium]